MVVIRNRGGSQVMRVENMKITWMCHSTGLREIDILQGTALMEIPTLLTPALRSHLRQRMRRRNRLSFWSNVVSFLSRS